MLAADDMGLDALKAQLEVRRQATRELILLMPVDTHRSYAPCSDEVFVTCPVVHPELTGPVPCTGLQYSSCPLR